MAVSSVGRQCGIMPLLEAVPELLCHTLLEQQSKLLQPLFLVKVHQQASTGAFQVPILVLTLQAARVMQTHITQSTESWLCLVVVLVPSQPRDADQQTDAFDAERDMTISCHSNYFCSLLICIQQWFIKLRRGAFESASALLLQLLPLKPFALLCTTVTKENEGLSYWKVDVLDPKLVDGKQWLLQRENMDNAAGSFGIHICWHTRENRVEMMMQTDLIEGIVKSLDEWEKRSA